jgi:hypothetical protein
MQIALIFALAKHQARCFYIYSDTVFMPSAKAFANIPNNSTLNAVACTAVAMQ